MLAGLEVVAHQPRVAALLEGNATAAADRPVEIHETAVDLGAAVALDEMRHGEALLEARPHLPVDASTGHHAQAVLAIVRPWRLIHEIAAHFAAVLGDGHAMGAHVVPELAGAEAPPQQHAAAAGEHLRQQRHAGRHVIERQHAVEDVPGSVAEERRPAVAHRQPAHVGDEGGLRQARGAGGEHEAEGALADDALAQRTRRVLLVRGQGAIADAPGVIDHETRHPCSHAIEAANAVELRETLGADEERLALRARADRVQQGRADDVRVDESRDAADLGESEPQIQKLGSVLEHHRHGVARSEPLRAREVRTAVHRPVGALVADLAAFPDQERAARMRGGQGFVTVCDGVGLLRRVLQHGRREQVEPALRLLAAGCGGSGHRYSPPPHTASVCPVT